ncbi:hypothetical protein [Methylobacterium persicinum]|uniref:Uncharacterized protein n=1 Tax=Methylobacterium persicinum TaxID=374426 RepID=A0ABU0HL20_9HYPH|nr:hypothetical protein [Methylobacterium persicinum]MDQ0443014.1 hypothetical protein [Methylobacterium persicinum]GJE40195.1 hypothetical protein KHHGKMAE_4285 [Methylobacterium persicinum]
MKVEDLLKMPLGGRVTVTADAQAMDWLEWAGFFPERVDGDLYVMRRDHPVGVLFASEPSRPTTIG